MRRANCPNFVLTILIASLAACGGGGEATPPAANITIDAAATPASGGAEATASSATPQIQPAPVARVSAATVTAQSTKNACNAVRPFYWEVGDRASKAVSGSVNSSTIGLTYTATTPISIASASKWLYGAYVVQKRAGALTATDRKFLSMMSGYASFKGCDPSQTVNSCLAVAGNGTYTAADDGKFYYDGGHMQVHASRNGLGAMDDRALAAEVRAQLGADIALAYIQPQLGGGLAMSADAYAHFLRKVLAGQLAMRATLGTGAVCTNPGTCGAGKAVYTPVPSNESWHYSVGHWVEDDPVVGDGAFSSAGAFGFYPWIDASKTYYGILARVAASGSGYASAQCGRLIRKAWLTGVAQ